MSDDTDLLMELSGRMLIGNGYTKSDIEEYLGRTISNEEWEAMILIWNDDGPFDIINEAVELWLDAYRDKINRLADEIRKENEQHEHNEEHSGE